MSKILILKPYFILHNFLPWTKIAILNHPMNMTLIVETIAVNIVAWLLCDIIEMQKVRRS